MDSINLSAFAKEWCGNLNVMDVPRGIKAAFQLCFFYDPSSHRDFAK